MILFTFCSAVVDVTFLLAIVILISRVVVAPRSHVLLVVHPIVWKPFYHVVLILNQRFL